MDEEEFVTVRVSEIVMLGGSIAQGMGELEDGTPCVFFGEAGRMVDIAQAIAAGVSPEATVPRSMLRLARGPISLGGGSESEGVTGSDAVTGLTEG